MRGKGCHSAPPLYTPLIQILIRRGICLAPDRYLIFEVNDIPWVAHFGARGAEPDPDPVFEILMDPDPVFMNGSVSGFQKLVVSSKNRTFLAVFIEQGVFSRV